MNKTITVIIIGMNIACAIAWGTIEVQNLNWLTAGVLIGIVICRRFTPSITDVDELRVKLEHSRTELERYRESVNGHFNKTSDLVNDLTQDFVKVYRHLSEGAQTLSDAPEFSHVLEQPKDKVLISKDEEMGSQDAVEKEPEDFSAQGFAAEVLVSETDESIEKEATGENVVSEEIVNEEVADKETADEEALTDADVFEPTDVDNEGKPKTASGSETRPDPAARTDTQ